MPTGAASGRSDSSHAALGSTARHPNRTLRTIRESERQQSREEFACDLNKRARELGENVSCEARLVARWEDGDVRNPRPVYRRILAAEIGRPYEQLGFTKTDHGAPRVIEFTTSHQNGTSKYSRLDEVGAEISFVLDPEPARSNLPSVDLLEQTIELRAVEAVDSAPLPMIDRLSEDLSFFRRMFDESRISDHERLMQCGALASALLAEELMIVGQSARSRTWSQMAVRFATEAKEDSTRSLVGALGARRPLYFGDVSETLTLARGAGAVAPRGQVSSVLAPLVEALAAAQAGDSEAGMCALSEARDNLDSLSDQQQRNDVFGLPPRRFFFYESRVLLDVGKLDSAWRSQDEALDLYPNSTAGDVAMLQLDRARLLIKKNNIEDGCLHAADVLVAIPDEQRAKIFYNRAWKVYASVPRASRSLPEVTELREVLAALPRTGTTD